jgi:outer membrane protein assembly factor BamB/uncharacterized protein Veg
MKKVLILLSFFALISTASVAQVYWNFIMDTCSAWSAPCGGFVKDGKYINAIQQYGSGVSNDIRIIAWDDQMVREDINTSIHFEEPARAMYQGIFKIHDGYFLANENSHYPLIKFDDNFQQRWCINIMDSLTAIDGCPEWWCEDSLTGNLFGTGNFGYPNEYMCSTLELSLMKLDSVGNVLFKRTYPGIFQNSSSGYLYDWGIPNYIGVVNNEIHISGNAMQFYAGTDTIWGNKLFFAKLDMDGNLLSLNFMGDKSAISWVLNDGIGYYIVRQEALSEYTLTDSKMQVYYKADIDAQPVLLFEDLNALPQLSSQFYTPIMTDQGILILSDHSDDVSVGSKLIMFDITTNSIAWQKSYVLDLDSSTISMSAFMCEMGYLVEMPDHGFAFSGSVLTNNEVFPWFIRTDACGDVVYNGCTISGVNEQTTQKQNDMIGFPNPCINSLTLKLSSALVDAKIQVINSVGQVVHMEAVNGRQQLAINTESLAPGVYIIKAFDQENSYMKNFTFVRE